MTSVLDLFEDVAIKLPSNDAVVLENGQRVSYAELYMRVNEISINIAPHLVGVTAEARLVAVMADRHVGLISSLLGVLKASAAYVPIDPSYPPDRQSYIFEHSKCKLLVADMLAYDQAVRLGVALPPTIIITPEGTIARGLPSKEETQGQSHPPSDLIYVLYTSGSTGKPKGVMVSHEGVANVVAWFAQELHVTPSSRVLGVTSVCFDISMLEIYLALTTGATLVMAQSATQKDPFRLLDLIHNAQVNIVQATPTTFEMMLATGWTGDATIDFLVGGEAFRPILLKLVGNCKSVRNVCKCIILTTRPLRSTDSPCFRWSH